MGDKLVITFIARRLLRWKTQSVTTASIPSSKTFCLRINVWRISSYSPMCMLGMKIPRDDGRTTLTLTSREEITAQKKTRPLMSWNSNEILTSAEHTMRCSSTFWKIQLPVITSSTVLEVQRRLLSTEHCAEIKSGRSSPV